jgi:hypothetical protein
MRALDKYGYNAGLRSGWALIGHIGRVRIYHHPMNGWVNTYNTLTGEMSEVVGRLFH